MKYEPTPSLALNVSARGSRETNPMAPLTTTCGRELAEAVAAVLSVDLDINRAMEDVPERKLSAVLSTNSIHPSDR
jgi:hypothetical protein